MFDIKKFITENRCTFGSRVNEIHGYGYDPSSPKCTPQEKQVLKQLKAANGSRGKLKKLAGGSGKNYFGITRIWTTPTVCYTQQRNAIITRTYFFGGTGTSQAEGIQSAKPELDGY